MRHHQNTDRLIAAALLFRRAHKAPNDPRAPMWAKMADDLCMLADETLRTREEFVMLRGAGEILVRADA